MNARIKLPAQEWLGYDPERGNIHGYTFEQMREFAELIVRGCYEWAKENGGLSSEYDYDALKEHFGVES